jgi:hypothetical protein
VALLMKHREDGWRLGEIAERHRLDEAAIGALIAFGEAQSTGDGGQADTPAVLRRRLHPQ